MSSQRQPHSLAAPFDVTVGKFHPAAIPEAPAISDQLTALTLRELADLLEMMAKSPLTEVSDGPNQLIVVLSQFIDAPTLRALEAFLVPSNDVLTRYLERGSSIAWDGCWAPLPDIILASARFTTRNDNFEFVFGDIALGSYLLLLRRDMPGHLDDIVATVPIVVNGTKTRIEVDRENLHVFDSVMGEPRSEHP